MFYFIDYRIAKDDGGPDFEMDYCDHCGEFTVHLGTLGGECSQCFDDRHCKDEI